MNYRRYPHYQWPSVCMEKIDRLGWAAGFSIEGYGVIIGVRASDPRVIGRLRQAVPYGVRQSRRRRVDYLYSVVVGSTDRNERPRRFHIAYSDLKRLTRTTDFDKVVEALEHDMPLEIGARTRQWVFVHAGVVGLGGRALLLPGRSFAGKSTLVEGLVRAGATYYSDEFAVLDREGRVHPFARPLSRRAAGEFKGQPVPVAELGGEVGTTPLPVAALVLTHFRAGARTRWRRLSPGQGVLGMMENAVAARTRPEVVLPVVTRVAQQATVLKGVRGEAEGVVPRLVKLLE